MKTFSDDVQVFRGNQPLRTEEVKDVIPDIGFIPPGNKRPPNVPRIISPALNYATSKTIGRGAFMPAEYDLSEVGRVEDTESYVRQSFSKKLALMFKEGYTFIGKNPKTIRYIKTRFAQIARATQLPTLEFMRLIGSSLVKKSNAFIVKVRDEDASGGRIRKDPNTGDDIPPIAGYFSMPAETVEFSASDNILIMYRQRTPIGQMRQFLPEDVVHFYFDRKDGFFYGTPTIIPVLDDIRALRKIEENIELLVYQYLFPLYQFQVGTTEIPAGIDEHGNREVDVMRREIQFMPSEGAIVTTERHKVTSLGAEGRALKADGYLEHFKKRVIAGLGLSSVDLGDADSSNRSTADNMSRNLVDSVKDFQQVFEYFFNDNIVNELLLESTFGPEVLDEENIVRMKFKEIDIDTQIKKECHYADQFNKNLINWEEGRMAIGLEPIQLPSLEEIASDEDLSQKYPEWYHTFFKLFKEPELLIMATKEPYSPLAMANTRNPSTELRKGDVDESFEKQKEIFKQQAQMKMQQRGGKAKDAFLSERFAEVQQGIASYVSIKQVLDHGWVNQLIRTSITPTIDYMIAAQMASFKQGYSEHGDAYSTKFLDACRLARIHFRERAENYINKLIEDINGTLKRNISEDLPVEEIVSRTQIVFDTLKFRANFIEDVEMRKAQEAGSSLALRDQGNRYLEVTKTEKCDEGCKTCNSKRGSLLDTANMSLEDVPPYHSGCTCGLKISEGGELITNATPATPDDPREFKRTYGFETTPQCLDAEATKIRQKNPDWSASQVTAEAARICKSKRMENAPEKRDVGTGETKDAQTPPPPGPGGPQPLDPSNPPWPPDTEVDKKVGEAQRAMPANIQCPKCGYNAERKKNSADKYHCDRCNVTFRRAWTRRYPGDPSEEQMATSNPYV